MVRVRFDDLVRRQAFEFEGLIDELVTNEPQESRGVLESAERAARAGRFVAGFVAYDAAPGFDDALVVNTNGQPAPTPLVWFGVFGDRRAVPLVTAPQGPTSTRWRARSGAEAHSHAVRRVKTLIEQGWTYQVNLTTHLESDVLDDPFELYRQLACAQRGRYNAYIEHDEWVVVSSSPECFFSFEDQIVTTRPMKGTAARGRYLEEDRLFATELVSSGKERAENVMIVDLIRNDLGKVATVGSVHVDELFALERFPTVWQLTSTVRARLPEARGIADTFSALFPCGSVTGAPKASTMRVIAELESGSRGLYCGAIGMIVPSRRGAAATFSVAIRTAVIDRRSSSATYGVGGGITWDSDATAEWAEIEAKSVVLTHRDGGFGLFETLRYDQPDGLKNLDRHLARLARSAEFFDIPYSVDEARAALEGARPAFAPCSRVRLCLDEAGEFSVEHLPLSADETEPLVLALDDLAVDASDRMLFHKTTRRSRYDDAITRHLGVDDVILVNSVGEVTETTRANLAVQLDGVWYTPELDSGLLPGVERSRLLDEGRLKARVIRVEDLGRATALATLSSLRGWRVATLSAS